MKKTINKKIIWLIILLGIAVRFVYILKTDCYERQHDVGGYNGHMEYIAYIFNNNSLPDNVDWQFYQPPIWHILCALFMKIQYYLGLTAEKAMENLQLISFFFSSLMIFTSKRIFEYFGLQEKSLITSVSLVAFHPTMIILSGSLNNDCMSLSLSLLGVLLAMKWFKSPKTVNILALAVVLGLSMGVKLSGGLVAIGIAMLFIIKLYRSQNKKNILLQFTAFGGVCIPLALWWQIRNYIIFKMPFTYVPPLSNDIAQYIGFHSKLSRVFDISSLWRHGVFPAIGVDGMGEFFEYNIFLGGMKSSVFGENYINSQSSVFSFFGNVLFYSALIITLLSVVYAIYSSFSHIKSILKNFKKTDQTSNFPAVFEIFICVCVLVMVYSYVIFCFKYPHFCSMDYRYIALTSVFSSLYIGLLLENKKMCNKIFGFILIVFTVLFSVSSLVLYFGIS